MKNMLELPKKEDYHETTIVDLNPAYSRGEILRKSDLIIYRRGFLNLRSIIDVFEQKTLLDVVDETKYNDFLREVEEWQKKNQGKAFYAGMPQDNFEQLPMHDFGMPKCPIVKHEVRTTNILYMNGVQRAMTDDLSEFQELYFDYLQRQKLDIG